MDGRDSGANERVFGVCARVCGWDVKGVGGRQYYPARVRVDDADVLEAVGALQHELLAVFPDDLVGFDGELVVDDVEELADVAEELLRDALAGRVDGALDAGAREDERRAEHGDRDGLAEAARRRDAHLLVQRVPPVRLEDAPVRALEAPGRLRLEKDARARAEVVLVELPLVERALPPAAVERRQRGPQELHALEAVDVGDCARGL